MESSFDINHYVDLSQVSDPRLKKNIEETLTYFASKEGGRNLLREAAKKQDQRIVITDTNGMGSQYDVNSKQLNIDVSQIQHTRLFTSPNLNPALTEVETLPDTLWHELEHARTTTEPLTSKKRDALGDAVDHEREAIFNAGEKEYMQHHRGTGYANDEARRVDKNKADDRIDRELNEYLSVRHWREMEKQPFVLSDHNPQWLKQNGEAIYRDSLALNDENSRLNEDNVIAHTNVAMQHYYPGFKPAYSHDGLQTVQTALVNSGTLPEATQAAQDARIAKTHPSIVRQADAAEQKIDAQYEAFSKKAAAPVFELDSEPLPKHAPAPATAKQKTGKDFSHLVSPDAMPKLDTVNVTHDGHAPTVPDHRSTRQERGI